MSTPKRIVLIGSDSRHEEALASAAITPGDLIEVISTGKVRRHATAGGVAERLFALEDALQGRAISTDYAADERVAIVVAQPGDVIYAQLSGGETAVIGSQLTSNGDGKLKVATGSNHVIAVAVEAVDSSDSNDVDEPIRVRVV